MANDTIIPINPIMVIYNGRFPMIWLVTGKYCITVARCDDDVVSLSHTKDRIALTIIKITKIKKYIKRYKALFPTSHPVIIAANNNPIINTKVILSSLEFMTVLASFKAVVVGWLSFIWVILIALS